MNKTVAPSGAYSSIDSVIQSWVSSNSLTLFTSFAGREERFCYISSPQGECFQISIQKPQDAVVSVDAWTVETLDNRELHEQWVVPIPKLKEALELALSTVRNWLG
jgi:hypothetical protein